MEEVEVKILEVDRLKAEKTLKTVGAKKVFDGDVCTLFFDFKNRQISKAKNVLRLRKEQKTTELTFKKVHFTKEAKKAEEYTVEISDFETMQKILENLGLVETEMLQKHRLSYTLADARFDFDSYQGNLRYIPEFLEIEASADLIHKYAKRLGFKKEDCLPWSTYELINHYSKTKK